jgi:hypothetical protein
MSDHSDLRQKIDEAKGRLPLPELLSRLGLGEHAKKSAHCPFHDDGHKSFSVFRGDDGFWHWKCHACCGDGDEIMFLSKLKEVSLTRAMNLFLDMAGFPPRVPHKSHEYKPRESREYPQCHESPEYPVSPVSPVHPMSRGQGPEKELKALAARNACTERSTARKRRWQLARDVRAVEAKLSRELDTTELVLTFNEWHRLSQPFLDPEKPRHYYLTMFLAELGKVRVPTGEGATITKALEHTQKLSDSDLPAIRGVESAPESWRRVAALHREMSRLSTGKTYFLSCRDTAKAHQSLSKSEAANINRALDRLGVIKIVRIGDRRPNGKASRFRYLLPQLENGADEDDAGFEL